MHFVVNPSDVPHHVRVESPVRWLTLGDGAQLLVSERDLERCGVE